MLDQGGFITKDTKEFTKGTKSRAGDRAGLRPLIKCGVRRNLQTSLGNPGARHIAGPFVPFVNSFVSFVMNLPPEGPFQPQSLAGPRSPLEARLRPL